MAIERILVTGGAGMVGSYAPKVFSDVSLIMTDVAGNLSQLDVCDPSAVMNTIQDVCPDVVIHLAAATDVDRCQLEPDWAYTVNAIGTQNVALACQATDALLVYISTGNVFSGEKPQPYTEFDSPNPVNVYGQSKMAGEKIAASLLNRYYIVRAGWMVGGGQKDKKFVGSIARRILEGNIDLKAVDDKYGSPTYAHDLLQGISKLLDTGYYGLYHMANTGTASRYQVAQAVRGILNVPAVQIESVSSEHFPMPAPRIEMEALRNLKLELLGFDWMRPWPDALEAYLKDDLLPTLSGAL